MFSKAIPGRKRILLQRVDRPGSLAILRALELLESSARQIYVVTSLGLPVPRYAHLPIAVDARGEKLSKQTHAAPLDLAHPAFELVIRKIRLTEYGVQLYFAPLRRAPQKCPAHLARSDQAVF